MRKMRKMKIEFNNKELEKIKPLVVWVTGCLARCDQTSDEKDGLGGLFVSFCQRNGRFFPVKAHVKRAMV